jgi:hypothetical protein
MRRRHPLATYLFGILSMQLECDTEASQIKDRLDLQVVGCREYLKHHVARHVLGRDKVFVPLLVHQLFRDRID